MIGAAQIETPRQRSGGRLRTLVLGVELWALALGLPATEHGLSGGSLALGAVSLPLSVLAVGEALRARLPRASRAVLLGAFPFSVALGSAARSDLAMHDAWAGALAPLLAISLFLYLAVVLHSFARPAPTRATGWQPVPPAAWSRPAPARLLGTGVLGVTLAAALFSTAALPFLVPRAALEAQFPLAADDARSLAIALGGGLFSIALGAIVGPGLRARRVGDPERDRPLRGLGPSLLLAVLAALGYAWLRAAS